jgi:2-polyprenyl-6-methoxyphenol hydroxylase-like FAD-dependent oxidoreductase
VTKDRVIIAGGGIGGLATALTLHQIGVPCVVFESVRELRSLGVGINMQPNAVRELYDLGIGPGQLDAIGLQTREFALVGLNGKQVYTEPRGLLAGYNWPQYSVHRGGLQMLLYRTVIERLGADAVRTGMTVTGYRNHDDGRVTALVQTRDGERVEMDGSLLIGADGLHSAVRAQMHPDQPPIQWGGAIMWRGTTPGVPIRTGASFVGLGTHRHRVVFYPISQPDPVTGLATINWIAEITVDSTGGWTTGDWNKQVEVESFVHHFDGWNYGWLDVPDMLRGADAIYEYPMIDRDPVPTWVDGRVALLGDAAHIMYPTGSNGASQAVMDARVLGAALRGDLSRRAAESRRGTVRASQPGGRALRRRLRRHRRGDSSGRARRLHEPVQSRGRLCQGQAERRAADHHPRRARSRGLSGSTSSCPTPRRTRTRAARRSAVPPSDRCGPT